MRVRVFLRQPLFTIPGQEHVPTQVAILEGTLGDVSSLGADLQVERFFDERGRDVTAKPCRLVIPSAKVDHVQVLA